MDACIQVRSYMYKCVCARVHLSLYIYIYIYTLVYTHIKLQDDDYCPGATQPCTVASQ